jgi:uncharacterized protein (DUF2147 family)
MKIKILVQATAALLVLATSAFAQKPEKDIVGKWADADGAESVEYKADGTFVETVGGEVVKGKFSFPDAGHVKVNFEGPMAAMGAVTSAITIKGDIMDITDAGTDAVTHYKRQK